MTLPRYPVAATSGLIATPHHLATQAGLRVLQQGGNAVDAAIAANAVLQVTEPHMCGLGGDLFMLIWPAAEGKLRALAAGGRSPYAVDLDWFRQRGITQMPFFGPTSISVPGVVDGWATALQRYGSRPLAELLAPAIHYAQEGYPIRRHALKAITRNQPLLASVPAAARSYLPGGRPPALGQVVRNPELAESLRLVARDGSAAVYGGGGIGQAILETCGALGWPLTQRDLEDHHSEWVEPISTTYRGVTIYELGPPNQGLATLVALNILEGYDLAALGFGTPEAVHRQVEAIKAAFILRSRHCADPAFYQAPVAEILSPAQAAQLREAIDATKASPEALPAAAPAGAEGGDTIFLCAADSQGTYVCLIQSNYRAWGSGIMPGETGFFLHSRGSAFQLDPAHPNRYEPHRRPFHTLIPAMAFRDGKPWLLFGTRGADGQPQTQVQLLCNLLDFGMNLQEALDAPRWRKLGTYLHPQPNPLAMESRFAPATYARLEAMGHDPQWVEAAEDEMGHASAILVDHGQGMLLGAADPRSDGAAAGW
ncbi:MAG: gamma-glutamyltransferase [Chloroflexi bacterium]|nr:gamma-glutamyltransferase [Chloroflexota bacterium]